MSRIRVIEVQHASLVAAVQSAEGPRAILSAGLLDALESAGASVDLMTVPSPTGPSDEVGKAFATARRVATAVQEAMAEERRPVVLSGPCHTAIGSTAGLPKGRRAVIWVDSHPDFNTPDTTESGLLDGMALSSVTGRCWKRLAHSVPGFSPVSLDDVLLVGVRDLDSGEASALDGSAVGRLSRSDLRNGGRGLLEGLAQRVDSVYVHVDLDVLDTAVGVANEYARPGGLTLADLDGFLAEVASFFPVRSTALTAYDPRCDTDGHVAQAAIRAAAAILL
jgi:arginase